MRAMKRKSPLAAGKKHHTSKPIIPTQRELRLIRDLQGVMIYDRTGAEPLLSYDDREIMVALHLLRRATPRQRRELALRAMVGDGDLRPAPVLAIGSGEVVP